MVVVFSRFLDLCLAKQRYGQLVILGNGAKHERTPVARLLKKGLNGEKQSIALESTSDPVSDLFRSSKFLM